MKKLCLCICFVSVLLLCGCAGKAEEKLFSEFSASLAEKTELGFVGRLRCEYDDRSVEFTLQYKQQDGGCKITVLQPEELEGLSVNLDEKGSVLEYGELFIDTGDLDHFGLSPLSALPKLVEGLKNAHVDSVSTQGDNMMFTLIPSDELRLDVSFDSSMTPIRAELISEGEVKVFCDIESWRF